MDRAATAAGTAVVPTATAPMEPMKTRSVGAGNGGSTLPMTSVVKYVQIHIIESTFFHGHHLHFLMMNKRTQHKHFASYQLHTC